MTEIIPLNTYSSTAAHRSCILPIDHSWDIVHILFSECMRMDERYECCWKALQNMTEQSIELPSQVRSSVESEYIMR